MAKNLKVPASKAAASKRSALMAQLAKEMAMGVDPVLQASIRHGFEGKTIVRLCCGKIGTIQFGLAFLFRFLVVKDKVHKRRARSPRWVSRLAYPARIICESHHCTGDLDPMRLYFRRLDVYPVADDSKRGARSIMYCRSANPRDFYPF